MSGHGIGCQAVRTPYIYIVTSVCEEIKISPPNLTEGGSLPRDRLMHTDLVLPLDDIG